MKIRTTSSLILGGLLASFVQAQDAQVLVGWNDFDGTVGALETNAESPTETATGFTGLLNGGQTENELLNIADADYGDLAFTFTPDATDFGVRLAPWNTNFRRLDFSVTNNSGADVTLGYIAFDARVNFYADSDDETANVTNIVLSHGPVSSGSFQSNLAVAGGIILDTVTFDAAVEAFLTQEISVDLSGLADTTLADGETASFRMEIPGTGGADQAGMIVDNIAFISAGTLPVATRTWAGYEVDEDGWADTGTWMGWIFVDNAPWLYNLTLDTWLYMVEENVGETGAWAYATRD